jgi:hypothetical protein
MSLKDDRLTSTKFCPQCSLSDLTPNEPNVLELSSSSSAKRYQSRRSQPLENGKWHGQGQLMPSVTHFHTAKKNWHSTVNTSQDCLRPSAASIMDGSFYTTSPHEPEQHAEATSYCQILHDLKTSEQCTSAHLDPDWHQTSGANNCPTQIGNPSSKQINCAEDTTSSNVHE